MQGRYLMPVFVLVPLTSGEVLTRNADRIDDLPIRTVAATACISAIVLNVGAL